MKLKIGMTYAVPKLKIVYKMESFIHLLTVEAIEAFRKFLTNSFAQV